MERALLFCVLFFSSVISASPIIDINAPLSTGELPSIYPYAAISAATAENGRVIYIGEHDNHFYQAYFRDLSQENAVLITPLDTDGTGTRHWVNDVAISADGALGYILSATRGSTEANELYFYVVAQNKLRILTNTAGEKLDSRITNFKLIGKTKDFYFVTSATNATDIGLSEKPRLYKYTWSTQAITLISDTIGGFLDISQDGSKITVLSDSNLTSDVPTDYSSYYSKLYIYDIVNDSYQYIPVYTKTSGYHYIYTAQFSGDGSKILYQGDDNVLGIFDIAAGETQVFLNSQSDLQATLFDYSFDGRYALLRGHIKGQYDNNIWRYDLTNNTYIAVNLNPDMSRAPVDSYGGAKFSYTDDLISFYARVSYGNNHAYLAAPDQYTLPSPQAVTNIFISTNEVAQISLLWDDTLNHPYYLLYRYKTSSPDEVQFLAQVTASSYIDKNSGLELDTEYGYIIKSCNSIYQCIATSTEGGYVIAPSKVAGIAVQASDTSLTNVNVSWSEVSDIEHYEINIRKGFATSNNKRYGSNTTNITYNTDSKTPQLVKVRACKNQVCGAFSDEQVIEPIQHTDGGSFMYTVNDQLTAITLHWEDNPSIDHYRVYRQDPGGNEYEYLQKVLNNEYTDTSIKPSSSNYRYAVDSCNENGGCGNRITISSVAFSQSLLEVAKPSLRITEGANYVQLEAGLYSDRKFESIKLFRHQGRFDQPELIHQEITGFKKAFNYFDSDIAPQQSYYYFVETCVNNVCRTSNDVFFQGIGFYTAKLDQITDLIASNNEYQDFIKLQWSATTYADKLFLYRDGSRIATLDAGVTEYLDIDIVPGAQYQYQITPSVIYLNNSKIGLPSNFAIGSTFYDYGGMLQLAKVEINTPKPRYYDRVTLNWKTVDNVYQYEVVTSDTLNGEYSYLTRVDVYNGNHSVTLRNLAPGKSFYYRVRACSRLACFELSEPVEASTSDVLRVPSESPEVTQLSLNVESKIQVDFSLVDGATHYEITRTTDPYTGYLYEYTVELSPYIDSSYYSNYSDLYYRVAACNAAGCGAPGLYEYLNVSAEVGGRDFTRFERAYSNTDKIIVSRRFTDYSKATNPTRVNVYVSQGENGERSLIESRTNNFSENVLYSDGEVGVMYFFWIENCFNDDCVISEEFVAGSIEGPEVVNLSIPENFTMAGGFAVDYVTAYVGWQPNGVQAELYYSQTLDGEKVRKGTFSDFYNVSLRDNEKAVYELNPRYYWARSCYLEQCSEFSSPQMVSPAPMHTNRLEMSADDKLWSPSISYIADDKQGIEFSSRSLTSSMQRLFIGAGFQLKADYYFDSSTQLSSSKDCLLRAQIGYDVGNVNSVFLAPLLRIYSARNSCSLITNAQEDKLYFVLGEDFAHATAVEAQSLLDTWSSVRLIVNAGSDISLNLNGKAIAYTSLASVAALGLDFAKILINAQSGNSKDVIANLSASSSEFATVRPLPFRSFSVYEYSSGGLGATFYRDDDATSAELKFFNISETGEFKLVHQATTTTSSYTYNTSNGGDFLVMARSCSADECSSYSTQIVRVYNYLQAPSYISVAATAVVGQLSVQWQPSNGATHYEIFGSKLNQTNKYVSLGKTTSINYLLNGIEDAKYYVYLKACDTERCSTSSSVFIGYPTLDSDGDGLTNDEEFELGTDPYKVDTDGDSLSDAQEVNKGTNPLLADTDGDGINDNLDASPLVPSGRVASGFDMDGNGKTDLFILGYDKGTKRDTVSFFDPISGKNTKNVYMPIWFSGFEMASLDDMNGNGVNELLILGLTSDGKSAWLVMDGSTGKIISSVSFPSWFLPSKIAIVPDYTGNNKDEIVVLGYTSTGYFAWFAHDSGLRKEIGRLVYPKWFEPSRISALTDTNGNSKPDILVAGLASDGKAMWMLNDIHTKDLINSRKQVAGLSFKDALPLEDVSQNGLEDVLMFAMGASGKYEVNVQDANTATDAGYLAYPSWYTPMQVSVAKDYSGNGFPEIVSLGSSSNGKYAWMAHDLDNHVAVAAKVFPSWYTPKTLLTMSDINNDSIKEVATLGKTTDGKVVIMIQNGVNGSDIKAIVLPSGFLQKMFLDF